VNPKASESGFSGHAASAPVTDLDKEKQDNSVDKRRIPPHRIFYEVCIIKWFIDTISPDNDMKSHFQKLLEQYPNVDGKAMGIPRNWQDEPLWKI